MKELFKELTEQIEINEVLETSDNDASLEDDLLSGDLMDSIEFDVILG